MSVDILKFAQDNVLLIAVAAASGGMLLWPMIRGGASGGLGTLEATQLINREDALVVDVRNPDEFSAGHIVNARNIPVAELEARLREIEKHKRKPVIVLCERGSRAGRAATVLKGKGFEKVHVLAGGIEAWRQAGLPVEKG
jgi:rhodanese-related sulfurtransferase